MTAMKWRSLVVVGVILATACNEKKEATLSQHIEAQPEDEASYLFDQSVVRTYDIQLSEENLAFLNSDPSREEYVEGSVLNPWNLEKSNYLQNLAAEMRDEGLNPLGLTSEQFIKKVRNQAAGMIMGLKKMIQEAHYLPDLAGIGNLILTPAGTLKLVDINNINPVSFSSEIRLDDKGYPVCDKSIEALALMEQKIADRHNDENEAIYRFFLAPERRRRVQEKEERFYRRKA